LVGIAIMLKQMDVHRAIQDLQNRTLAGYPRALDRLIYLASTRDYNTGVYYHDGLAARFTEEVACQALADCHRAVFRELSSCTLKDLVSQVEGYQNSTHTNLAEFITAWRKLEPYRVAIPVESDPLSAEFLFSNLKIALAILETHLNTPPKLEPVSWQRPSLAQ
jgi:hypothetical protein